MTECRNMNCGFRYNRSSSIYGCEHVACLNRYTKEVVYPCNYHDIEFLSDWWEGEKYIKLFGIKAVSELDISGGIYSENDKQEE